jgi:hypothetical protein
MRARSYRAHLRERLWQGAWALFAETAEVRGAELVSASVLPEQFYDPRRGAAHIRGESALMRAVPDDALHCDQKQCETSTRRTQRLATEAAEWLFSDDERWPFSFVNVCAALGFEPEYLRRGRKRWGRYLQTEPQRKPRRRPALYVGSDTTGRIRRTYTQL